MLKPSFKTTVTLICSTISCIPLCTYAVDTAPISGFARSFLFSKQISKATVTVIETGDQYQTNKKGEFGPFYYPVGQPLTLEFKKWGYKTTQSATMIVPKEGLTGPYNNITFQVPSIETYYLFSTIIGAKIDSNSCHLTSTITAYHKTLDDLPQGEEHAKLSLIPAVDTKPFYFGIYKSGPLKGKTNPFARGLTETSEDGGLAMFNLAPRDEPYILTAQKHGKQFTQATFICKKGTYINISPPRGPMALKSS